MVAGKGQFGCGARGCDVREGLASFEVLCQFVILASPPLCVSFACSAPMWLAALSKLLLLGIAAS